MEWPLQHYERVICDCSLTKTIQKKKDKIGVGQTKIKKGAIMPTLCQLWIMALMGPLPRKRGYKPY